MLFAKIGYRLITKFTGELACSQVRCYSLLHSSSVYYTLSRCDGRKLEENTDSAKKWNGTDILFEAVRSHGVSKEAAQR